MLNDAESTQVEEGRWVEANSADHDAETDQVGTVEVQILLSWFFETSTPGDVSIDVPRAA